MRWAQIWNLGGRALSRIGASLLAGGGKLRSAGPSDGEDGESSAGGVGQGPRGVGHGAGEHQAVPLKANGRA